MIGKGTGKVYGTGGEGGMNACKERGMTCAMDRIRSEKWSNKGTER